MVWDAEAVVLFNASASRLTAYTFHLSVNTQVTVAILEPAVL